MFTNVSKSKFFLISCIAFIAGIVIASFLPERIVKNDLWWFIGIVIFSVMLTLFWRKKNIRLTALTGLFLFLAVWRYAISLPITAPDKIWHYNGQEVAVIAVVVKEPDVRQTNQKLEIKVKGLKGLNTEV